MDTNEKKFNDTFKQKGGLFKTADELHSIEKKLLTNFSDQLKNIKKTSYKNMPIINVNFINNLSFNACATKRKGIYYIGINIGVIYILSDVFSKILSTKNILKEIGNINLEREEKKTISVLHDNGLFFDLKNIKRIIPIDKIRSSFAFFCFELALSHIFLHECGHVLRGHIDALISSRANYILDELNFDKTNQKSKFFFQTLEMDADSFSVLWSYLLARYSISRNHKSIALDSLYENRMSFSKYWAFIVYCTYRLFDFAKINLNNSKEFTHPPAVMRTSMIIDNYFKTLSVEFDEKKAKQISNEMANMTSEAELAFNSVTDSENKFFNLVNIYKDQGLINYKMEIVNNWDNVRPLLEGLAYGDLPTYGK